MSKLAWRRRKRTPRFANYEEEVKFWDTHDALEYSSPDIKFEIEWRLRKIINAIARAVEREK